MKLSRFPVLSECLTTLLKFIEDDVIPGTGDDRFDSVALLSALLEQEIDLGPSVEEKISLLMEKPVLGLAPSIEPEPLDYHFHEWSYREWKETPEENVLFYFFGKGCTIELSMNPEGMPRFVSIATSGFPKPLPLFMLRMNEDTLDLCTLASFLDLESFQSILKKSYERKEYQVVNITVE